MKLLIVLVIIVSAVQLSQVSAEESCDSMSSENDTSLWNCVTGMGLNALSTYPYLKYLLIFFNRSMWRFLIACSYFYFENI